MMYAYVIGKDIDKIEEIGLISEVIRSSNAHKGYYKNIQGAERIEIQSKQGVISTIRKLKEDKEYVAKVYKVNGEEYESLITIMKIGNRVYLGCVVEETREAECVQEIKNNGAAKWFNRRDMILHFAGIKEGQIMRECTKAEIMRVLDVLGVRYNKNSTKDVLAGKVRKKATYLKAIESSR